MSKFVIILTAMVVTSYLAREANAQRRQGRCCICGDGLLVVGKPEAILTFPGRPAIACGELEDAGAQGLISMGMCSSLTEVTRATCECIPSSPTAPTSPLECIPSSPTASPTSPSAPDLILFVCACFVCLCICSCLLQKSCERASNVRRATHEPAQVIDSAPEPALRSYVLMAIFPEQQVRHR